MKTTYSEQTTINPRDMQRYLQRARSLRSEAFYRVIKRIGQTIELNFGERESGTAHAANP